MSIHRKFSVPYTEGMLAALEDLDVDSISDVYFSDNKFGSARSLFGSKEMFDELYAIRDRYGIKLHYLVNPSLYSNEFYGQVFDLIEHVKNIDVDMITLNNSYLLRSDIIKDFQKHKPDIVLKNSVNNLVRTLKDFVFMHEVLHLTHIIVDRSLNRDIDTLCKMSAYAKQHDIKITMLVNEGCIVDCKWKQWDDLIISQIKIHDNRELTSAVHNNLGCVSYFKENPAEWLKTAFTFPNDLNKFDGLVDVIKLAGRSFPITRWTRVVDAYQRSSGNIRFGEILSTTGHMPLAMTLVNDITELGFNQLTNNCKTVCSTECDHCDKVYDKKSGENHIDKVLSTVSTIAFHDNIDLNGTDIVGLTSERVRKLLYGIAKESKTYLEVGCYHGATASAVLDADIPKAYFVDNWQENVQPANGEVIPNNDKQQFIDNVKRYKKSTDISLFACDLFDVDTDEIKNVDFFFYDGPHDEYSTSKAVQYYSKSFADTCIMVFDDANWEGVVSGADKGISRAGLKVLFEKKLLNEQEDSTQWWNGLYIVVVTKQSYK
jgi:collagenase-like PrtC family protease